MFLDEIVQMKLNGRSYGITSICSSHPAVLTSALQSSKEVLIEATCNQVNQFGGYTGMTPAVFVNYVNKLAETPDTIAENIVLGGDHLGPSVWQDEPAENAMRKSEILMRQFAEAGFSKFHIDCSMPLADDKTALLDVETSAQRSARLACVVEQFARSNGPKPVYVIGTEVPVPGGIQLKGEKLKVTSTQSVKEMIDVHRSAFIQKGLESAWERVIAIVVQPGVEYGEGSVIQYNHSLARHLIDFISDKPFVYEVHSTDYQDKSSLNKLVEDGFCILKVGPALTFAFREIVFSLAMIENELYPLEERSNLIKIIDAEMEKETRYWSKYYSGNDQEIALARKYSLSDRIRYYWNVPIVSISYEKLINNIAIKPIPVTLLHQFGLLKNKHLGLENITLDPLMIIREKISEVLHEYYDACHTLDWSK